MDLNVGDKISLSGCPDIIYTVLAITSKTVIVLGDTATIPIILNKDLEEIYYDDLTDEIIIPKNGVRFLNKVEE